MKSLYKAFYQGKKVLVTGGAGFIGSHLVEALIDLGAHVTVLDNFSTGSINNLRSVITTVKLQYADVSSPFATLKATVDKDIVFHLAALVSVPQSIKNSRYCTLINEQGTQNMLAASVKNNVKTFVFSSSAAIYGNKKTLCVEDDIAAPESPYASSKLQGEQLCKEYATHSKLNTVSLRYFNVYGERQNPAGDYAAVVAKFTDCLINNKPIIIYGDGRQTRDFIHVSQVVNANLLVGLHSSWQGDVFNVATGKSINLFELIELLEQTLGIKNKGIIFQPARQGDISSSQASIEKLKSFINLYQQHYCQNMQA